MDFIPWLEKVIITTMTAVIALFSSPATTTVNVITPERIPVAPVTTSTELTTGPALPDIILIAKNSTTSAPKETKTATVVDEEGTPVVVITKKSSDKETPLLSSEILIITNKERKSQNIAPLLWSKTLEKAAIAKAKDMIAKQYFAHQSPDGIGVSDLAKKFGYDYSLVGENLALGDFASSKEVMEGWMNSPGHRRNILKAGYTQIGIAAIKGLYEGRTVWYAVQEFGRPPQCTPPNKVNENLVKNTELQLQFIAADLVDRREEIEARMGTNTQQDTLITQYNALTSSHNELLAKLKIVINTYNNLVTEYNACIAREKIFLSQQEVNTEE